MTSYQDIDNAERARTEAARQAARERMKAVTALAHVWEDFEDDPQGTARAVLEQGGWSNGLPIGPEEQPALEELAKGDSQECSEHGWFYGFQDGCPVCLEQEAHAKRDS